MEKKSVLLQERIDLQLRLPRHQGSRRVKTWTKIRKKNFTIRLGWKRSLIVTLVVALIVGTYSFADFGPKAQAAEYVRVNSVTPYTNTSDVAGYSFNMDDGSSFHVSSADFYRGRTFPAGIKKLRLLVVLGICI